jgi:diacylglycerol kinase (ATP)
MSLHSAQLIFNPHAGSWEWGKIVDAFSAFWRAQGWDVLVTPTERPGHAVELAADAATRQVELVFAAGGDGTMHEVANGLAKSETIMAPLPVGTANILAKELAIPTPRVLKPDWWTEMLETLATGRVQRMDLGHVDIEGGSGRYWMLWASAGADGFVIDQIEPRTPKAKRFGMLGYAAKAAWFLPAFKGISGSVSVDGQDYTGDFLMVNISNCRRYAAGEFNLNRAGVLDDGLFEVWIFRGKSWPMLLRYSIVIGLDGQSFDPNIERIQAKHVRIETDVPTPFHLDAEPSGSTPLTCTIEPGALRILVPSTTPKGLFEQAGTPLSAI